jgi:catechol 2,3-dioxygenase-like lactoylglutathione lyase family enzyme
VHHTGFTVSDLDQSVAFYTELLGCDQVTFGERHGGYLAEIVGYEEAHVRLAHLRLPGCQHVLELFEYLAPESLAIAPLEPRVIGAAHLCFVVRDLDAYYRELLARGVESFVSGPVEIDSGFNKGGSALYLRDPDGITVELFQPPPTPPKLSSR